MNFQQEVKQARKANGRQVELLQQAVAEVCLQLLDGKMLQDPLRSVAYKAGKVAACVRNCHTGGSVAACVPVEHQQMCTTCTGEDMLDLAGTGITLDKLFPTNLQSDLCHMKLSSRKSRISAQACSKNWQTLQQ
jgi:hypothetical protein